jgi:hypothetical protein
VETGKSCLSCGFNKNHAGWKVCEKCKEKRRFSVLKYKDIDELFNHFIPKLRNEKNIFSYDDVFALFHFKNFLNTIDFKFLNMIKLCYSSSGWQFSDKEQWIIITTSQVYWKKGFQSQNYEFKWIGFDNIKVDDYNLIFGSYDKITVLGLNITQNKLIAELLMNLHQLSIGKKYK